MTNLEAKQEVIKRAWGDTLYSRISWSDKFDHDGGWMEYCKDSPRLRTKDGKTVVIGYEEIDIEIDGYETPMYGYIISQFRPKTLKNIEVNNGWIRIETDGGNLPERNLNSHYDIGFLWPNGNWEEQPLGNGHYLAERFKKGMATHYKPFVKNKKPIY